MNSTDRCNKYKQYLNTSDINEAMRLLKEAFTVTQDDIDKDVSDIVNSVNTEPIFLTSARFNVLMHDLRDMRDVAEINKSRKYILKEAFVDKPDEDITKLFPV